MPERQSPTIRRRRLATTLRQLRDAAGLTIDHVAAALEVSSSKISRIENAQVRATPRDVRDLLDLYGVTGQYRDELLKIAREARQPGWWHKYRDTREAPYIGFETVATSICYYQVQVVPGLFQTRRYARAILDELLSGLDEDEITRHLELRMQRQALLTQQDPPRLSAVLDEAVLRRPIGGPGVMAEQLEHLIKVAELPNVELRVLPFKAGVHAGLDGSFDIIEVPDFYKPDIVHYEENLGNLIDDDPEVVERYQRIYKNISSKALDEGESLKEIERIARELSKE